MSTKLTKEEFIEKRLKENTYFHSRFKMLMINFGIKENKCEICGISEWQGKPISCQLHHINGNRTDNRLENLQILCPNCHSQTENYMSKNTFRYQGKDKVCVNCGKPFVARGDSQRFCCKECLKAYNSRHQRIKESPYSTEYLLELCNKYNTLEEIGLVIHRTRVTVKRYLIMHGLFEDFERKRNFHTTPVLQYDATGTFIKEWPCLQDAQETLGIKYIREVCIGKRKAAGGFLWKYKMLEANIAEKPLNIIDDTPPKPIEILQYDLNGDFIREYATVEEASKVTDSNKTSIILCAQGKHKQANNYVWRFKNGTIPLNIDVSDIQTASRSPVLMYSAEGVLLKEFDSISQASRETGLSIGRISQCARGVTESSGGYIWRYKNFGKVPIDTSRAFRPFPEKVIKPKVPILQYSLEGCFIKEYESIALASKETGVNLSHIAECTYGNRDRAGNFMWKAKEGNEIVTQIAPYKEKLKRAKPILQYDKQGNFVREYQTIEEAMAVYSVSRWILTNCLDNPKKSYAGYVWRNKEGDILQTIDVSGVIFDSKQNVPVQKFDLEGNFIQEYPSIFAASKACGVSRTYIKHSIEGHSKCVDNCVWKYA